ncbi:MAG: trypsin-like peptidase domain-containing protein [Nocardia sp.]|nr:trypsin-like peptidase domain-containing protein [Nocardia sp.]
MDLYPTQGNQPYPPGPHPYGHPYGPYAYGRQPVPPQRPEHRHGLTFALVASLVAVVALAIGTISAHLNAPGPVQASPFGQGDPGSVGQPVASQTEPAALDSAAGAVAPGIVIVNTVLGMANGQGAGTGIVLSPDGTILTNNHVVEGATSISVTDVGNSRDYTGSVVGFDRQDDLAVVKLKGASGLRTAPLGSSGQVRVGDSVVGLGNAGGSGTPTAASGRVTALDRSITASDESAGASEQLTGLIQVAADIQPGDSGGPLINSSGQVVGVDTAASQGFRMGTGGGQGFAIPIDKALPIAKQIEAGTASDKVHIGDSALLGIAMTDAGGQGALVRNVVSGGPAEAAGVNAGATITALDGTSVTSATALTNAMDQHHPGDTVTLTWIDQSGQQQSAKAALAKGPVG